jgi:hypothetical protein
VCAYCRSRYTKPSTDSAVKESKVSLNSDVERLLEMCRREPVNATRYANLILDIDPTNREARSYL